MVKLVLVFKLLLKDKLISQDVVEIRIAFLAYLLINMYTSRLVQIMY